MRRFLILTAILLSTVSVLSAQTEKSKTVLSIDGRNYYIHKVVAGETMSDLSAAYRLGDNEISESNPQLLREPFTEGTLLRIPCYDRLSRLMPRRSDDRFVRYRVGKGMSLFAVASQNAISIDVLVEDNAGLDITDISERSTLFIRTAAAGITQLSEIRNECRRYAEMLNKLSQRDHYFVVEAGGTLYSMSRTYSLSADQFLDYNGNPQVINAGMVLKVPAHAVPILTEEVESKPEQAERTSIKPIAGHDITVSLLLPMTDGGEHVRGSFVEFYQGALLAADKMKESGCSVNLNLFDTQNSPETVSEIVADPKLAASNLIVGPVYERNMQPAADYARSEGIPMVSPLAAVEGFYGDNFYQMPPVRSSKLDKLRRYGAIAPETNVVMIYTASTDAEMEQEMLELIGQHPYGKVVFDSNFVVDTASGTSIEDAMVRDDNLFVILSDNELEVDRTLAIISSIMNSRQPKYGATRVPIRVIGSSKWARYRNLDKHLLFKLDVSYVTSYHADRSDDRVRSFDSRYLRAFGRVPSLYAYRAYDVVMLFCRLMFEGGEIPHDQPVVAGLQMMYCFDLEKGNNVNDQWALVTYNHDYTISVN